MSLFRKVKNSLRLLNDDNDEIIKDIMANGKNELNQLVGVELDFEKEGLAQALFIDYCRYSYHNAIEYFESNNIGRLNRLILMEGAKADAKRNEEKQAPGTEQS